MVTEAPPDTHTTNWPRRGKRVFDLVGATVTLALCFPLLFLIAIVIKATSPGPVFFRQTRAGKDARPFTVIKFRTMRGDRTPDPKELVPLSHSDITGIGRVLRRLKLDELPQIFNVLRGDMSLVGPRPTLPDQAEAYDDFRRQRLLVKPGLTGLAQVYSSAASSWDERILYDVAYVRLCSPALDALILLRTLLVILLGEHRTAQAFFTTRFAKVFTASELASAAMATR